MTAFPWSQRGRVRIPRVCGETGFQRPSGFFTSIFTPKTSFARSSCVWTFFG